MSDTEDVTGETCPDDNRACPKCGHITLKYDPIRGVKTVFPPLYFFKCECGHTQWSHRQRADGSYK